METRSAAAAPKQLAEALARIKVLEKDLAYQSRVIASQDKSIAGLCKQSRIVDAAHLKKMNKLEKENAGLKKENADLKARLEEMRDDDSSHSSNDSNSTRADIEDDCECLVKRKGDSSYWEYCHCEDCQKHDLAIDAALAEQGWVPGTLQTCT